MPDLDPMEKIRWATFDGIQKQDHHFDLVPQSDPVARRRTAESKMQTMAVEGLVTGNLASGSEEKKSSSLTSVHVPNSASNKKSGGFPVEFQVTPYRSKKEVDDEETPERDEETKKKKKKHKSKKKGKEPLLDADGGANTAKHKSRRKSESSLPSPSAPPLTPQNLTGTHFACY
tara:strand:- start:549 stop:1070 length:522 start_codon:yes stop_codon:yes gene_type:complete